MANDLIRSFCALSRSAQETIVSHFALAKIAVGPWLPSEAVKLMLVAKDCQSLPRVERAVRDAATKERRSWR